jgi:hypothetical protein
LLQYNGIFRCLQLSLCQLVSCSTNIYCLMIQIGPCPVTCMLCLVCLKCTMIQQPIWRILQLQNKGEDVAYMHNTVSSQWLIQVSKILSIRFIIHLLLNQVIILCACVCVYTYTQGNMSVWSMWLSESVCATSACVKIIDVIPRK